MMIARWSLVASSLCAALFSSAGMAQNVHTSRLYEQILENVELTLKGHVLDTYGIVRINAGESSRIVLDVPTSTSIEIMGDCDQDCQDLDLIVRTPDGKILARDTEPDFYPIVSFVSGKDGRIEIELDLKDCIAGYCYAAYSIFVSEE